MKFFVFVSLFALTACDMLAGQPGSWGFRTFASNTEIAKAREEQSKAARINCESLGYTKQGLYACIRNSVNM